MQWQEKYIPQISRMFADAGFENEIIKENNKKKESTERKQKGVKEGSDSKKTEWCKTTTLLRKE